MIITGLHHYTMRASAEQIDVCVSFYTSVLNLRIGFRPPLESAGYWLYAGDQPVVQLIIGDEEEPPPCSALEQITFACINLPVTIRRLEDLGIDYTTNHLAETEQFQVFLRDPLGLALELNFACEKI